jgi:hypothetical protein
MAAIGATTAGVVVVLQLLGSFGSAVPLPKVMVVSQSETPASPAPVGRAHTHETGPDTTITNSVSELLKGGADQNRDSVTTAEPGHRALQLAEPAKASAGGRQLYDSGGGQGRHQTHSRK